MQVLSICVTHTSFSTSVQDLASIVVQSGVEVHRFSQSIVHLGMDMVLHLSSKTNEHLEQIGGKSKSIKKFGNKSFLSLSKSCKSLVILSSAFLRKAQKKEKFGDGYGLAFVLKNKRAPGTDKMEIKINNFLG